MEPNVPLGRPWTEDIERIRTLVDYRHTASSTETQLTAAGCKQLTASARRMQTTLETSLVLSVVTG